MILELNGYAVALLGAAYLSTVTTCAARARRKQAPGGTDFALMMACIVLWGLTAGMEAAAATLPAKILFSKLSYVGICGVAPLFLRFAVAYARKEMRRSWRALLWAVPVVTLFLVFTNERHHLVWTGFTQLTTSYGTFALYSQGAWYRVWLAWYAAASIASLVLVVHAAPHGGKIYVRQTFILVTGMILPWIGEAAYLSAGSPFPRPGPADNRVRHDGSPCPRWHVTLRFVRHHPGCPCRPFRADVRRRGGPGRATATPGHEHGG